jgi:hypothetical protein
MSAIIHLYHCPPDVDQETTRRVRVAQQSWRDEQLRHKLFSTNARMERTSLFLGDRVASPYVLDILSEGMRWLAGPEVVILTNADIGIVPGGVQKIIDAVAAHGSAHLRRREFPHPIAQTPTEFEMSQVGEYPGMDAAAFTCSWWKEHGTTFPDMLYGRYGWDGCMRNLLRREGSIELHNLLFHETHNAYWNSSLPDWRDLPGNRYNEHLFAEWVAAHGGNQNDHLEPDTAKLNYH